MKNQFYFPNINIAYSSIPKCACSTIKKSLLMAELGELTELSKNSSKVHELVKPYQADINSSYPDAWNLVVIREPYERLLSAFLDKFCTAYENPERFVIDFLNKYNINLKELTFYRFLEVLNKAFRDKDDTLNEHWDSQFRFIDVNKNYQLKYDFSSLNSLQYLGNDKVKVAIKTIDEHSTPKSKIDVDSAAELTCLQLLNYRKKYNSFPSSKSFLNDVIGGEFEEITSQALQYKEFLQIT